MIKYVVKRLLILIPTLLAVIFIVFFITNLTPGDPGSLILGQNARKEDIAKKNEELGKILVQKQKRRQEGQKKDGLSLEFGKRRLPVSRFGIAR